MGEFCIDTLRRILYKVPASAMRVTVAQTLTQKAHHCDLFLVISKPRAPLRKSGKSEAEDEDDQST